MTKPTVKVITDHLARAGASEKQAKKWAKFLHGLDWTIIKPLTQMARGSKLHPALAAGMAARATQDENIKTILTNHIEAKAGQQDQDATCPCSYPEGWDACPVHRDGVPTPPPATPSR